MLGGSSTFPLSLVFFLFLFGFIWLFSLIWFGVAQAVVFVVRAAVELYARSYLGLAKEGSSHVRMNKLGDLRRPGLEVLSRME